MNGKNGTVPKSLAADPSARQWRYGGADGVMPSAPAAATRRHSGKARGSGAIETARPSRRLPA
jgi:hypothetical protein